jgi:hypothetical protein
LKLAWENSSQERPYLEKNLSHTQNSSQERSYLEQTYHTHKKNWAQGEDPEFKSQYCKKKKKGYCFLFVYFKMPRGNLEVVHHRALVLAQIRKWLDK